MRKIAFIPVLLVVLLNVAGYYPVFKVQQWRLHHAVEEHLAHLFPEEQQQLRVLAFKSTDPVEWERPGKELRHQGSMYDVVKKETRADSTYYYCYKDDDETRLFALLTKAEKEEFERKSLPFKRTAKNLLTLFQRVVCPATQSFAFYCPVNYIRFIPTPEGYLFNGQPGTLTQPPESLV